MWPVALSGRLPVVALVGRYPTNKLIGREPIPSRNPFHHSRCLKWSYLVLIPVSRSYPRARGRLLTCYSPVRRSSTPKGLSARLACVKHAASVRPEPGSNSPLMSMCNRWVTRPKGRETPAECRQEEWPRLAGNTSQRGDLGTPLVRSRPLRTESPLTGFVHYALAFSTLLSSQGADAHRHQGFRLDRGQPC